MITSMTTLEKFRCFDKGFTVEFHPGVNLLVGDQGCGKSSIIALTKEHSKRKIKTNPKKGIMLGSFDFEKANPRVQREFNDRMPIEVQIGMAFASHGQTVKGIIGSLKSPQRVATVILLDEPDMALSIRSCKWLADELKALAEKGVQIIAAVHNPIIIQSFPEVYSVEHRRWMPSDEFIKSHLA